MHDSATNLENDIVMVKQAHSRATSWSRSPTFSLLTHSWRHSDFVSDFDRAETSRYAIVIPCEKEALSTGSIWLWHNRLAEATFGYLPDLSKRRTQHTFSMRETQLGT